jgi:hypothetical protein
MQSIHDTSENSTFYNTPYQQKYFDQINKEMSVGTPSPTIIE